MDVSLPIEIPKRTLFKASEVCDLVKVQPYVLRSWEGEFPGLGVAKTAGGPRVYRRTDIEQVIRIKHLLLVEGLTLAGARRKLEEEAAPAAPVDESLGPDARDRLTEIKRGLRSILDLLSPPDALLSPPDAGEGFVLRPSVPSAPPASNSSGARAAKARGSEKAPPEGATARRKRSAS